MAKIKVLTPDIYNLISAGEVVDAPVGAVKEVVENSIDAGANRITIEIANGGFEAITITDNGCGMTEEASDWRLSSTPPASLLPQEIWKRCKR